jgi:hypothetical protein
VLRQVTEGVLIHESEFIRSNAVVVQGRAGVLVIDPGIHGYEMAALTDDLRELGQAAAAGFRPIRIGITCSGTPSSARCLVTRRPAARRRFELSCRTRIGRTASPW